MKLCSVGAMPRLAMPKRGMVYEIRLAAGGSSLSGWLRQEAQHPLLEG